MLVLASATGALVGFATDVVDKLGHARPHSAVARALIGGRAAPADAAPDPTP